MYQLKQANRILATHKTRRQCVIEAYERGLVVYGRGKETLIDGVTIEPTTENKEAASQ